MRVARGPAVIKLGGSFASSRRLPDWIEAIARCGGRAVLVPGGGPFADAVRTAQRHMQFDDETAHALALQAMEQFGRALIGRNGLLQAANSIAAMRRHLAAGRVPVWMPVRMVLRAADIEPSWRVTSDSLAVWLAHRLRGSRLLLVKHGRFGAAQRAQELAAAGIVDRAFPRYLRKSGIAAFIVPPGDRKKLVAAVRGDAAIGCRVVC